MRRRDHPQIGDLWISACMTKSFTVLGKERDESGWHITILVGGDAGGEEGQIKHAYFDEEFTELEGIYWKVA